MKANYWRPDPSLKDVCPIPLFTKANTCQKRPNRVHGEEWGVMDIPFDHPQEMPRITHPLVALAALVDEGEHLGGYAVGAVQLHQVALPLQNHGARPSCS